jgi:hypothetical protein
VRGDRSSLTRKSTGAVRPAELKIARPPPTVRGARQRQVAGREGEGLRARAVMKFAKFAGLVHVVTTLLLPAFGVATPLAACTNIGAEPVHNVSGLCTAPISPSPAWPSDADATAPISPSPAWPSDTDATPPLPPDDPSAPSLAQSALVLYIFAWAVCSRSTCQTRVRGDRSRLTCKTRVRDDRSRLTCQTRVRGDRSLLTLDHPSRVN